MAKLCKFPTSIGKLSNVTGTSVKRDSQGRFRVTARSSKALIGTYNTEDEVRKYLTNLVDKNMKVLDGNVPVPVSAELMAANAIAPGSQLSPLRTFIKLGQVGLGRIITPMKQYTQAFESLHPVFKPNSKVYAPTQAAMHQTAIQMNDVKRVALNGRTFEKAVHDLEGAITNFTAPQREQIFLYAEAYTKQELRQPGVLLKDGLDDNLIQNANLISSWGMAEEIPTLVRTNALIDDFLHNREVTLNRLHRMEVDVVQGRLPQEILPVIENLRGIADVENLKNRDDVIRALGLSGNEERALLALKVAEEQGVNIPAMFRYASAPELGAGFKTGRQQFAKVRGMTPEMVRVAEERLTILREAYKGSGFSADQVIGAQFPVFRQFIDAGIFPGMKAGGKVSSGVSHASKMLEGLQEGRNTLTRRVLSGHINPHSMHPAVSTFGHVRNMVLRETLDPVLPVAMREIKNIADVDERVAIILTDYVNELQGLPNESFQKLNDSVRTMAQLMGVKVGDRFAEQITAMLSKLAYQASIPFRPALILRNFTQTAFFTAPVVGGKSWGRGLHYATHPSTRQQALEEAIKGGALSPNVTPLFDSTRIMGMDAARVSEKMGPALAKAGFKVNELFEHGFSAYRSADDWGRAVAFHAGRDRVKTALAKWRKNGGRFEELDDLVINAKVRHFDENIEDEFRRIVMQGDDDIAASFIGKHLADKTHLLYGNANHPAGWGGVGGRLFGQFGTFPIQYANYLIETSSRLAQRGSYKDLAEFATMHSALNMGIVIAGSEIMGVDMQSWATLPSIGYTGGPYAEVVLSLAGVMGGSDAERALALSNLKMMFPSMEYPSSIFVPGSYFAADVKEMFENDDLLEGLIQGAGFRFLKPKEDTFVDKGLSWIGVSY